MAENHHVRFGVFEADFRAGELRRSGARVPIQEQPFHLLQMLLQHPGDVVTREEIHQALWPDEGFRDFDHAINVAVKKVRDALGDDADKPVFVETMARRGYRFIAPTNGASGTVPVGFAVRHWKAAVCLGVIALIVSAAAAVFYTHRPHGLKERDMVVLADFVNSTGEPVFDDTLKLGLTIQLEQSPFLYVLPDERVNSTLKLMAHKPGERITQDMAREICLRTSSQALISGSIAKLGNSYAVALRATNCQSGDALASVEMDVDRREHVLRTLGREVTILRAKLGESLASVRRFDKPLEEVTTSSLEALKEFGLAVDLMSNSRFNEAIESYRRAIEIDPNFVTAYSQLGWTHFNRAQNEPGRQYVAKAYELRDRVSEHERLLITGRYYETVTGEFDKAMETYERCLRTYPRYTACLNRIGVLQNYLGQFDKAAESFSRGLRITSTERFKNNLAWIYQVWNRNDEAKRILQQKTLDGMDSPALHQTLYEIAIIENNGAEAARQLHWFETNHAEQSLHFLNSRIAAYSGRRKSANRLQSRHMEGLRSRGENWALASVMARSAIQSALYQECTQARQQAQEALDVYAGDLVKRYAAYVFAQCGDSTRAKSLSDALMQQLPADAFVNELVVPNVQAAIELNRGHSDAAIEWLSKCRRFESGDVLEWWIKYLPTYTRGMAYLKAGSGKEAAVEFEKITGNRGPDPFSVLHALSFARLGQAYALVGETEEARRSYEHFLMLWKDADPDIPICRTAKAEYAKLNVQ